MDTDDVERVELNALGGADSTTIDGLSGTDVAGIDVDLGGQTGEADSVNLTGSAGKDSVSVSGSAAAGTVKISGEPEIRIANAEPTDDLVGQIGAGDNQLPSCRSAQSAAQPRLTARPN